MDSADHGFGCDDPRFGGNRGAIAGKGAFEVSQDDIVGSQMGLDACQNELYGTGRNFSPGIADQEQIANRGQSNSRTTFRQIEFLVLRRTACGSINP